METQLILLAVAIGLVALNQAYQQPVAPVCRVAVDLPERDKVDTIGFGQIGRASCRERVCQYV